MHLPRSLVVILLLSASAGFTAADENALNPQVRKIVGEISEDRIRTTIARLSGFGTRNTMSAQDDPAQGIGAARRWIMQELKGYSPRLEVRFDRWRVKKQGRVFQDADLYNVVAVLRGTRTPEAQVWIAGHYDSLNAGEFETGAESPRQPDWEKVTVLPAPGACDDGSGTAAVMELARVMSAYQFDKTLVFVAFAGEEQGLFGATLAATRARQDGTVIEAVLNNDIIGTEVTGNGRSGNSSVNVFSDDVMDSPSQELARFARRMGERYLPGMGVNTVFMQDRLARGGDHVPFQQEGYAAVRFTTPNENYAHQHTATDTLANMSVPYTARVARVNAAVAASLALAPRTPDILSQPRPTAAGAASNPQPARRAPMISRGPSRYDARLQWQAAAPDSNLAGYAIVMRPTTATGWTREIFVGKVNEFTLKDVSVDELRFGVKAIGSDGTESLAAPFVYPSRPKAVIETVH